jgi:hypothetical protein
MSLQYKLDKDKNAIPCSIDEYVEYMKEMYRTDTKHVALDTIKGMKISTVFLGINHQWGNSNIPLIFETMVFDNMTDFCEIYLRRYSTWQEAEEGHAHALEWVKNGCKKEDL